jgi:type I restriction enzyme, S subunit
VDALPDGAFPFFVRSQQVEAIDTYSYDCEAVLTAGDGAGVGKVFHHFTGRFEAHQRVYVFKDFHRVLGRYFFYYFSNLFSVVALQGTAKSTVESLRRPMLADFEIAVPPMTEQRAIVVFIERETAQIDALIAKQERLVELLDERRGALIDTVTWRGVSATSLAEATGVEPAPVSPSHWRRLRNKNVFAERIELSEGGDEELLTVSHLTGVTRRSDKVVNMFEAQSLEGYKVVHPDDLVINTLWAWMGALGVSALNGIASPAYGVYRPLNPNETDSRYFNYLYRSRPYVCEMTRYSKGVWSSRLRLYPDAFLRLSSVVPTLEEQHEIADHLDRETAKIDALVEKATAMNMVLRERRSALITAAVTGKIEVAKRTAGAA